VFRSRRQSDGEDIVQESNCGGAKIKRRCLNSDTAGMPSLVVGRNRNYHTGIADSYKKMEKYFRTSKKGQPGGKENSLGARVPHRDTFNRL